MTDAPETHYTRPADGTNLAYQVSGDGPLDLVFRRVNAFGWRSSLSRDDAAWTACITDNAMGAVLLPDAAD